MPFPLRFRPDIHPVSNNGLTCGAQFVNGLPPGQLVVHNHAMLLGSILIWPSTSCSCVLLITSHDACMLQQRRVIRWIIHRRLIMSRPQNVDRLWALTRDCKWGELYPMDYTWSWSVIRIGSDIYKVQMMTNALTILHEVLRTWICANFGPTTYISFWSQDMSLTS